MIHEVGYTMRPCLHNSRCDSTLIDNPPKNKLQSKVTGNDLKTVMKQEEVVLPCLQLLAFLIP